MAVTLTDQRTIINEADATTSWTGSATVTLFTTEPTGIESTGCLGMVVSNATQNAYFTITSFDFSTNPSLVYLWIFHRAELDTRTNGGLMIQFGDGTNRVGYHVAGADVAAFRHDSGPTGWQCLVVDTANLPSSTTTFAGALGSLNFGAITQIGVAFKTLVKAVGGVSNCFWDISRRGTVGQGLLITAGTSGDPGTWSQIASADRGTGNQQAYGVVRQIGEGAFGVQGPITFGDTSGTTASYFSDSNVTVVFEERGLGTNKYLLTIQGNSTGSTTFIMSGSSIVVPATTSAQLVATDSDLQVLTLTNTSIVGFRVGAAFSNNATNGPNHSLTNVTFRNCGQIDPGRVVMRGCTISGYTGTTGALLWNANIDIEDCHFSDNTDGTNDPAGIYITATGTYDFIGLTFSGNDYDLYNNSGGLVTINVTGGGDTPSVRNGASASTVINNNVLVTLTGLVADTEVRVYDAGTTTEIDGEEDIDDGSFSFSSQAGEFVDIRILNIQYVGVNLMNFEIPTADTSIPIQQQFDRNYSNT